MRSLFLTSSTVLMGLLLANLAGAAASKDTLVRSTRLPESAQELRQLGVNDGDLNLILDAARQKGLGAGDAQETLDKVKSLEKQGHVDNLGQTVKGLIESGLKGQALAAAIQAEKDKQKAEKENNGLGRPEEPPGQAGEQGRSDQAHEKNAAKDKAGDKKDKSEKGGGKGHGKKGGK